VDRRNFYLFQQLPYQIASGAFSPGEIAYPLRGILARQRNARVVLADVAAIDLAGQIAEIARDTLRHEFRAIDPGDAEILLI
jgi:NADH dehydrogenase